MPIEYSVSIVNNENNSGMILEDIFNCQPEIIRKYFGMQIDMEIELKCKFYSDNFIFIVIYPRCDIFRSLQPEAAPTESFTEPEAIMLENINEFNNQLSHWRQRLTIPNTDQIQVIRDRLDQTVSMVGYFTF